MVARQPPDILKHTSLTYLEPTRAAPAEPERLLAGTTDVLAPGFPILGPTHISVPSQLQRCRPRAPKTRQGLRTQPASHASIHEPYLVSPPNVTMPLRATAPASVRSTQIRHPSPIPDTPEDVPLLEGLGPLAQAHRRPANALTMLSGTARPAPRATSSRERLRTRAAGTQRRPRRMYHPRHPDHSPGAAGARRTARSSTGLHRTITRSSAP